MHAGSVRSVPPPPSSAGAASSLASSAPGTPDAHGAHGGHHGDPNLQNAACSLAVAAQSAAEAVGAIPRGTHHWEDFVTPDELRGLLAEAGLAMGEPCGIAFSPGKGLHLSDDLALNYLVTARRA